MQKKKDSNFKWVDVKGRCNLFVDASYRHPIKCCKERKITAPLNVCCNIPLSQPNLSFCQNGRNSQHKVVGVQCTQTSKSWEINIVCNLIIWKYPRILLKDHDQWIFWSLTFFNFLKWQHLHGNKKQEEKWKSLALFKWNTPSPSENKSGWYQFKTELLNLNILLKLLKCLLLFAWAYWNNVLLVILILLD